MKLFAVLLFVGIAAADKLPSSYIPPGVNAYTASAGHGPFLQAPVGGHYVTQPSTLSQQTYHQPQYEQGQYHQQGQQSGYHGQASQYQSHQSHHHGEEIPILRFEDDNHGDGNYRFGFESANGIVRDEEGHLANAGTDHEEQVVSGSYSYTGDDGHKYTVHYTADANGFHATGDHLPTPPPIPEAIQRSLEYNAAHAHDGDSGSYSQHQSAYQSGHQQLSGGYQPAGAYSQTQHHVAPQQQYIPPRQTYSHNPGYNY